MYPSTSVQIDYLFHINAADSRQTFKIRNTVNFKALHHQINLEIRKMNQFILIAPF